ncbi:uncharacterized protein [Drosophila pseudoobscura]|uniref:Uncharacterized protein isoform X2 n=1 Tax=Drosophila pseudoobscura pseudoobscura TaxID=46245 RepID=A0A6I8W9F3_DROPS|nr:uncharacterized protein LOC117183216 isoform X2 [Drosophila pseudoobscura]
MHNIKSNLDMDNSKGKEPDDKSCFSRQGVITSLRNNGGTIDMYITFDGQASKHISAAYQLDVGRRGRVFGVQEGGKGLPEAELGRTSHRINDASGYGGIKA